MTDLTGARLHITGIVQGVGFRPFIFNLAAQLHLSGWVRNTSAGVDIEVDGLPDQIQSFVDRIQTEAPPLAVLDSLDLTSTPANHFTTFEIIHSEAIQDAFQPISPDVCVCDDCLKELFDPSDRRYHYPFINCTNCGPRFTIIQDIPYDRPKTTMSGFVLCRECAAEYQNPLDRRFHAQPVACPLCGPHVWLETAGVPALEGHAAIQEARRLLLAGKILAIKGLGGFHLACNAANPEAVRELRRRKLRVEKPFAIMLADMACVDRHVLAGETERLSLASRARPIVILPRLPGSSIAVEAAPRQETIGVMLPYTPLHYLLFADSYYSSPDGFRAQDPPLDCLVMTSGNLSEEPIATDNGEALTRLNGLADAFLIHNRPIQTRCDDSVIRVIPAHAQEPATIYPIRRSRGYAPDPIRLPFDCPPILASGAELKNTFCLTRDRYAFLSHHIGDLENYETLVSFETGIHHFENLFRVKPAAIACDMHPDYLATRYSQERSQREKLPLIPVQHHHAHIAACMAENGLPLDQRVIGVSFDGTGYGLDGAIWGGEFLVSGYRDFTRLAHLAYQPLPGGDAAVRKPARIALAYLWQAGLDWDAGLAPVSAFCADERAALRTQLETGLNTAQTSSMGRLFDAVAALAGVCQKVNYEAQAAIELEALALPVETGVYPFGYVAAESGAALQIDPVPLIEAAWQDALAGAPASIISARFHNGVAAMVLEVCTRLRAQTGINALALSGGVWQNLTLLTRTLDLLHPHGFTVLIHSKVPANDGGLALGQAVIAAARLLENDSENKI
jgi:hydrogenase maturation protein HypF